MLSNICILMQYLITDAYTEMKEYNTLLILHVSYAVIRFFHVM